MDTARCQELADRLHALLLQQLGMGLDATRMLHEPLYARDVLLVCAAHPDSELARLAQEFRDAAAPRRPGAKPVTGADAAPERPVAPRPDSQLDPPADSEPPAHQAPGPLSRFSRLSLSRFGASIFGGSLFEGSLFGSPRIDPVTDFGDDSYLAPRTGQAPRPGGQRPGSSPGAAKTTQRRTRWFGR